MVSYRHLIIGVSLLLLFETVFLLELDIFGRISSDVN
jgi:hypothetical protein